MKKVAVVTGGNRGLGFETCRQLAKKDYRVVLTSRTEKSAQQAVRKLADEGLEVLPFTLDVTNKNQIVGLGNFLTKEFGRVDVLINNAGIFPEDSDGETSALKGHLDLIKEAMETNVYGPFQLCQTLIPLMVKKGYGRIVNLSSGMGQLSEMNGGFPAYRISKTAINTVTRMFSEEFHGKNILVNSVCPGWVKTEMGGPNAELEITEGVDTIVWLATLPDGSASGGFFRERKPLAW